ncbi:lysophosphatidic acid receptor 2-like [Sinocyclocheilus grahami]|uniref:lysophosphatidic acid receptor 2-like n=1 Tax=Sinocyclocheilus grahami TaxID=75366 RepID=UPI0007ACA64A|nr:PREDICTED: lysophosphatidic acid receptor 2-like [Sinocyclocheilus grahami]
MSELQDTHSCFLDVLESQTFIFVCRCSTCSPLGCVCFCRCTAGCFVVCWTPGLVLLLLDGLCESCDVLTYEKFFLVLAECNSFMNPIIYSYRDKDMRDTFKRLLCFPCLGSQQKGEHSGVRFNTLEQEVLSESDGTQHDNSVKPPLKRPL